MTRSTVSRCFSAALVVALVGCSDPPTGPAGLLESLPRPLAAAEEQIIAGSNSFAFDLLREVVKEEQGANVFISPLSVSMALGMTLNGAAGTTYDQMRSTLGFSSLAQLEINSAYADLIDLLLGLDPTVELTLANSIWHRNNFPFEQSFFDAVRGSFDAEVAALDFDDPASVGRINSWVAQATGGRIDEIVESIDPNDVMYLINALHFKAEWRSRFDPAATFNGQFTRSDGSRLPVRMMSAHGKYRHAWLDGVQAIDLPYGNGAFGMLLILPKEGSSADALTASLSAAELSRIGGALVERELDVSIPRFTLEYETSLKDPLSELGMPLAFTGAADFTRLNRQGQLFLSEVKHKTFVAVDEKGTEAAAVTKVGVQVTSAPPSFRADRPFVFVIHERLSGTILFAGKIEMPEE